VLEPGRCGRPFLFDRVKKLAVPKLPSNQHGRSAARSGVLVSRQRTGRRHSETRPRRTLGLVLMDARVAEIDQDAVTHVLRNKAVVAPAPLRPRGAVGIFTGGCSLPSQKG
jgi:hypothetical protein